MVDVRWDWWTGRSRRPRYSVRWSIERHWSIPIRPTTWWRLRNCANKWPLSRNNCRQKIINCWPKRNRSVVFQLLLFVLWIWDEKKKKRQKSHPIQLSVRSPSWKLGNSGWIRNSVSNWRPSRRNTRPKSMSCSSESKRTRRKWQRSTKQTTNTNPPNCNNSNNNNRRRQQQQQRERFRQPAVSRKADQDRDRIRIAPGCHEENEIRNPAQKIWGAEIFLN